VDESNGFISGLAGARKSKPGIVNFTVHKSSISMQTATAVRCAPSLSQGPMDMAMEPVARESRLLSHQISAGFPSPATDYLEEGLDLNDYLVRNKPATFLFTVKGDSMIGASIEEGDKVIVDRALTAKHDDIVVAVVDGEYKRHF
jgi:SOS-response transcriptional repressor LexA